MASWLGKGKRKSTEEVKDIARDEGVSSEKKIKTEVTESPPDEAEAEPMDIKTEADDE